MRYQIISSEVLQNISHFLLLSMQGSKENIQSNRFLTQKKSSRKSEKPLKIKAKVKYEARQQTTPSVISKSSIDMIKKKKASRKSCSKKENNYLGKARHSVQENELRINLNGGKNMVRYHSDNILSFREYCSVEGEWVPLLSGTQREKLVNLKPKIEEVPRAEDQKKKCQNRDPQNLQQIFQELQRNLPEQDFFKQISDESRKHYSGILSQIMKKLKVNDPAAKTPAQSPRDLPPEKSAPTEKEKEVEEEEKEDSPVKNFAQAIHSENIEEDITMKMERMVKLREEEQLVVNLKGDDRLVRGFSSIFIFTEELFLKICESEVSQSVLRNLKVAQGYPKLLKLRVLMQGENSRSSSNIIPEEVFDEIEEESNHSACVSIFNRCVFDALNEELVKLRPYYETNGQTFPWSFKMPAPITFYEISEESFDLAILEARTKVVSSSAQLCGLLLPTESGSLEGEMVKRYRDRKEFLSVKQEIVSIQSSNKLDLDIENYSTVLLIGIADCIMGDLCGELFHFPN